MSSAAGDEGTLSSLIRSQLGGFKRLFVAHAMRASEGDLAAWFGAHGQLAAPPDKHGAFAFVEARWRRIRPPRDLKLG
jgi:hypothetical protein